MSDDAQAVVLTVTVDEGAPAACAARLNERGFFTENLTDDETTQVHLRHMVGGSANVDDERIYKVEIPERAGALDARRLASRPNHHDALPQRRRTGGEHAVRAGRPRRPRRAEEAIESRYAFEDMTSNAAYNVLYGCQRVGACAISFDEDEA